MLLYVVAVCFVLGYLLTRYADCADAVLYSLYGYIMRCLRNRSKPPVPARPPTPEHGDSGDSSDDDDVPDAKAYFERAECFRSIEQVDSIDDKPFPPGSVILRSCFVPDVVYVGVRDLWPHRPDLPRLKFQLIDPETVNAILYN